MDQERQNTLSVFALLFFMGLPHQQLMLAFAAPLQTQSKTKDQSS
jgi:hypothetical protein